MDAALSSRFSGGGLLAPTTTSNSSSRSLSSSYSPFSSSFLIRLAKQGSKKTFGPLFLETRLLRSLPPSSLPTSSSSEADAVTTDSLSETTSHSKTVHVKFVLQKACLFGQHFLIVGDDPIIGLWDPENAIPMMWSEGHVWTADLDLPVGKSIQFKFILRSLSGEISWQPGSDRILQTWETTKTIVVLEDWEIAENRELLEEELVSNLTEEFGSIDNEERAASDETKMGFIDRKQEGLSETSFKVSENSEGHITSSEGDLVLVPGLASMDIMETSSVLTEGPMNTKMPDASVPSEEEILYSEQFQGQREEPEIADGNLLLQEASLAQESLDDNDGGSKKRPTDDVAVSAENLLSGDSDSAVGVVRNDIQWGRKVFDNLLSSLGFNTDRPLA